MVVDGAGSDIAPSSRASQHLFTGQHADVESDLHYFGARTYDPLVGRFLEVDPELVGASEGITFGRIAGAPQNLDGYAYTSNNPTNRVDPTGRSDLTFSCPGCYASYGGLTPDQAMYQMQMEGAGSLLGAGLLLGGWAASAAAPAAYSWVIANPTLAYALGYEALEVANPGPPLLPAGAPGNAIGDAIRAAAREVGAETTTLYRAVSHAEAADLLNTGAFRAGPNSFATGKWFAESAENAAQWGTRLEGAGNFQVIESQLPRSAAEKLMRLERLDGIGPARFGTFEQLEGATIRVPRP